MADPAPGPQHQEAHRDPRIVADLLCPLRGETPLTDQISTPTGTPLDLSGSVSTVPTPAATRTRNTASKRYLVGGLGRLTA